MPLSHIAYVMVDFKKVLSDLSHGGSALVEKECFKRKTRLSEYSRNIIASEPFLCNTEVSCNASV